MYPLFRFAWAMWRVRKAPPLELFAPHHSVHFCWPWDLDPWRELNNGRTLTLFDLGRVPAFARLGMLDVMRAQGWQPAVAGVSVRYRRRVRAFDRLDMVSRLIGWDARFWYAEQSMWRGNDCTTHMLVRGAITGPQGLVPPADVAAAMGKPGESPPLPDWVAAWIEAEAQRPWPPESAP
jgi:acyl-CoA thioesterase FadM